MKTTYKQLRKDFLKPGDLFWACNPEEFQFSPFIVLGIDKYLNIKFLGNNKVYTNCIPNSVYIVQTSSI